MFDQDPLYKALLCITSDIFVFLFVYQMGPDPTAWLGELTSMTRLQLLTAIILINGDITSLGLIYSLRYVVSSSQPS